MSSGARGRIALVLPQLSEQGGTERRGYSLARSLGAAGFMVELHCASAGLPPPEGCSLHLFRGPVPRGRGPRGRWLEERAAAAGRGASLRIGMLRAPGFDLLRAGGGSHAAYLRAVGRGGRDEDEELERDQRALRSAGLVVVNSRMAGRDVLRDAGLPAARLRLVRNGVDLARFGGAPTDPRPRVVFVGHGFARKGLSVAIDAFASLARGPLAGHELWVLGRERQPWRWQARAWLRGVGPQLRFLGGGLAVEQALAGARALLLPTAYDPSANVVLEAMACGVPPLTSPADGAAELLPEAWMAPEPTAGALAAALVRCLQQPELGARCRAAAALWPAAAADAALIALIEAIAEGRAPPGESEAWDD